MNYSWAAYEQALQLLTQYISSEKQEYALVYLLQKRLLENIAQARTHGDSDDLATKRKKLVEQLDDHTSRIINNSFIHLCIKTSPLLAYLFSIYKAAQEAHAVLIQAEIWADQCNGFIAQFHGRTPPDRRTDIDDITVALSLAEDNAAKLLELLEDFQAACPLTRKASGRTRDKRTDVLHKLEDFIREIRRIDTSFFEGLITQAHTSHDRQQSSTNHATPQSSPSTSAKEALLTVLHVAKRMPVEESGRGTNPQARRPDDTSTIDIDQTRLRQAVLEAYRSKAELKNLCFDVTQVLRGQGVTDLIITLDTLEGTTLPEQVLSLIETLDQRGYLPHLITAARRTRPQFYG